jgi:hypothetical protein
MSRDLLPVEKAAQRNIKSVKPFLHLFPKPDMKEEVPNKDGNVMDTVRLMRDVVFKYMDDTKKLAPTLKGKTLEETCKKVWDFWYWHVQYKLDIGEQLRRPARTIYEQLGDCDCFSIAVCQTLLNLHVDCSFSVAKYPDEKGVVGNWQHVYVTVRKPGGGYYTLDCVAHQFNKEQPFADKFNYSMTTLNGIPISVLSGFSDHDDELLGIVSGKDFDEAETLLGLGNTDAATQALDAVYKHLVSTRDYIQKNPQSVITTGGAGAHLQMLNYAISKWNTPDREQALDMLEQEEERWNEHNGVSGLGHADDEDEFNGLGASKSKKKFWSKVKETVKKVTTKAKEVVNKTKEEIKKDAKKAGEELKKIGKALIRFNPLSLAVRGGFLLAMKINLLDMGTHLYPAYLTEEEAKKKGISSVKWNKAKKALAKIENMFVDKLQGKSDKLKSAIVTGRATRHFAGFGILGEPATITAVTASAAPLLEAGQAIDSEGAGADASGQKMPVDMKALLAKIKEWWTKTFGHEKATAPETITDEDKEPNDKTAERDSTQDEGSDDKKTDDKTPDTGDSGWIKFKQFVKDNPVAIGVGVAAVGTVVTLAVAHSHHKKQQAMQHAQAGLGSKPKKKRKNLPPPHSQKLLH